MQALRKTDAHAQSSHAAPAERESTGWVAPRTAGDGSAAQSPALQLRDHLAARLEEFAQLNASDAAVMALPAETKLPMQARIAVIVGLSVSLWVALGLAITAVL